MKTIPYKTTLFPCALENGFYSTTFSSSDIYNKTLPEKTIEATGVDDLLAKVEDFAKEHGKPCQASVGDPPRGTRKPAGFDKRTTRLYYNHAS